MNAAPTVSVLVRTRNDAPFLARTLDAIAAQAGAPPFEVLVCDDGSTDGTAALLAARGDVRPVPRPAGEYRPGRTLNALVRAARGEIVVFDNADAVPLDGRWLAALVAPLAAPAVGATDSGRGARPCAPAVGATFARQVPRPDAWPWVRRDYARAFGDGSVSKNWPRFFSLASAAFRRDWLLDNPFDETLLYSEDVELVNRGPLVRRYVPEARVEHSHNYTRREWARRFYGEGYAEQQIFGDPVPGVLRVAAQAVAAALRDGAWARRLAQKFAWRRGMRDAADGRPPRTRTTANAPAAAGANVPADAGASAMRPYHCTPSGSEPSAPSADAGASAMRPYQCAPSGSASPSSPRSPCSPQPFASLPLSTSTRLKTSSLPVDCPHSQAGRHLRCRRADATAPRLRVLFTGVYPELNGGLERFAARAADALRRAGHAVDLVGDIPRRLGFYDRVILQKVPRRLADLRRLKLRYGDRLRFYAHDHELYCLRRHYYGPTRRPCDRAFAPFPCRLCAAVTRPAGVARALTRDLAGFLREMRDVPTFVQDDYMRGNLLKNGFHPETLFRLAPFWTDAARERGRDDFLPPGPDGSRPLRILFAGQLVAGKGVAVLLDAVAQLAIPWTLTVVGAGRDAAALKARAASLPPGAVTFAGWQASVAPFFAQADVVALPSLWNEPFGLVGAEALAAGTPVVAFDRGGVGDWLRPGVTGLFAAPPDGRPARDALARALADALATAADPDLLARLSRNGAALVRERYSTRQFIEGLCR